MEKLLPAFARLRWAVALVTALVAAAFFRQGLEEIAAIIWLFALILVLPMWSQSK